MHEIRVICCCTESYFFSKMSQGRGKIHFQIAWSFTHIAVIRPTTRGTIKQVQITHISGQRRIAFNNAAFN